MIIVFDLTSKESFMNVAQWMKEVEKHAGEDVQMMVLANKADCAPEEVEVSDAEIKKFEEEAKVKVIKTSAKSGQNVDDAFLEITKKLIVKKNNSSQEDKKKTMGLKMLRDTAKEGGAKDNISCC